MGSRAGWNSRTGVRWETVLILGSHSSLFTRAKPGKQRPPGLKMDGPKEIWNLKKGELLQSKVPQWLPWAKALQLCPILWDPVERSPPGSSVYGIFQTRILEWVAIPFSRVSSQPRDQTRISYVLHWQAGSLLLELPDKESAGNSGDLGSIPGLGRSLRGGNGDPFQCSCLGNPMDRGTWWATVMGSQKSQTWLSD